MTFPNKYRSLEIEDSLTYSIKFLLAYLLPCNCGKDFAFEITYTVVRVFSVYYWSQKITKNQAFLGICVILYFFCCQSFPFIGGEICCKLTPPDALGKGTDCLTGKESILIPINPSKPI